jgi:hypothetical protein
MTLNKPLSRLVGCLDVPLIVPVTLLAALVVGLLSGCGTSNTQPSSNLPSPATASPSAVAPLTDEQRAEEQAFDLWLAELIQPVTEFFGANALGCPKEGDKVDISYSRSDMTVACAHWAFQITSTGKVNGVPLSGAAMVTANTPETQRFVTVSWSCSGPVYTTKYSQGVVVRSGANSSAGTIERSQIRISDTSGSISDADRANGITWQGSVLIQFIERLSYSAEVFSNVAPYEQPTKPRGVGQLTSYTDVQSKVDLALQNGKLVTSDHKQIVPGERIFYFGTTGNHRKATPLRSASPSACGGANKRVQLQRSTR